MLGKLGGGAGRRSNGNVRFLKMDTEHANALTSGDEEAVARFVAEHAPRLLQAAQRLLACEEDARDAVQDAFVSAIKSIDSFDRRSQLSTWLHRIVVNAALMRLRARRRRPEVSIEALLPAFYDDGHRVEPRRAWAPTAVELLERRETRQMLERLLADLPDEYRTVLVLRDIEGLDTRQTAEHLQTSEGAVKTRLHRARAAMRTLLEQAMLEKGT